MRADRIKDRFEMRMIRLTQAYLMGVYQNHICLSIGEIAPVSLLSRRKKKKFNSPRLIINGEARRPFANHAVAGSQKLKGETKKNVP
jgi:hypothetical protein